LAASKLAAGREKDWLFVEELLHHKIVDGFTLQHRIEGLPVLAVQKERLKMWVSARMPA
jgi:hypothetical protein